MKHILNRQAVVELSKNTSKSHAKDMLRLLKRDLPSVKVIERLRNEGDWVGIANELGVHPSLFKYNTPELTYSELLTKLSNHVVGLEEQKSDLLAELYLFTKRKQNAFRTILVTGNSGSGKSHLCKSTIELLDEIEPIYINAASLVSTGIVGTSLDNIIQSINNASSKKICIVIDEFDKFLLKEASMISQFLMLIEGRDPCLRQKELISILIGSFAMHGHTSANKNSPIGFIQNNAGEQEDSLAHSIPAEYLGRISRHIHCDQSLELVMLQEYLRVSHSPIQLLNDDLLVLGHELVVDYVQLGAWLEKQSLNSNLGVRGIFKKIEPLCSKIRLEALMTADSTKFYLGNSE